MRKKILWIALAVLTVIAIIPLTIFAVSSQPRDVSPILNATMAKLADTVKSPSFGTNAGEWTVLSLARGEYYGKDDVYFSDYYDRIVETVNQTASTVNMNGALHKNKSTENSRLIVALSSIGKDATSVGEWNLVEAYAANGLNWIKKQGLNGTIWALIALDSNNYEISDKSLRQQCVDEILARQHNDGGWALQANKSYASDPDVTGMALQALYPYRHQEAVADACAAAFVCLSEMQHDNGTFASGGSECSESCAWVIVACTAWGIDPDTDSRFIKNGKSVVDGLLIHYLENEAQFQHVIGAGSNGMATDQACYALVAYNRFIKGKKMLFDFSDVTFEGSESINTGAPKATLGLPSAITDDIGRTFNATINLDTWDNEAGYKLIDLVLNVPKGLSVANVTADKLLCGGTLNYNLEADTGKLRIVYFDANQNSDLTVNGNDFPLSVFTVTFRTESVNLGDNLEISLGGISLKRSSVSTDEGSMTVVDSSTAKGSVSVVSGISFSAVCLYTGDDIDLIPSSKKAVMVSLTGIETPITLM